MANVSADKIKEVSSELKQIISNIEQSLAQTNQDYNNYLNSLETLKSYDGSLADCSKEDYLFVWRIFVTEELSSSKASLLLDDINEKLDLLVKNDTLLYEASEEIANYLAKLEEELEYEIKISNGELYQFLKNVEYPEIAKEGYTAQGYAEIGDLIFITAYSKGNNSRIFVYDNITKQFKMELEMDNNHHVGGITYDKEHDIIFITGHNGEVEAYDYTLLKQATYHGSGCGYSENNLLVIPKEQIDWTGIKLESNISIYDKAKTTDAATISYDEEDSALYVSNYDVDGTLVKYNIDRKGNQVTAEEAEVNNVGAAVQGIGFYEENGEKYMVTSSSALGTDGSLMTKYQYNSDTSSWDPISQKVLDHKGAEGFTIDSRGDITVVSEYEEQITEKINVSEINEPYNYDMKRFGLAVQANAWNLLNNNWREG